MIGNTPEQPEKKSKNRPVILIIACALLVILFGYGIWASKNNENKENSLNELGGNTNEEISPTNTDFSYIAQMTNEQRDQARMRDDKRLTDIKKIQAALEAYKRDNDSYPASLTQLKTKYLSDIPQNTYPGGTEYNYTPIGGEPYSYYDLSYTLEVGTQDVGPGEHTASPGGVATP